MAISMAMAITKKSNYHSNNILINDGQISANFPLLTPNFLLLSSNF